MLGCVKRHFPLGDAGLSRTVSHCTVSRDCHSPHSIDMRCCVSMKTTVARSPAPNHGRSGRIVVVPVDIAPSSSRRKCFSGQSTIKVSEPAQVLRLLAPPPKAAIYKQSLYLHDAVITDMRLRLGPIFSLPAARGRSTRRVALPHSLSYSGSHFDPLGSPARYYRSGRTRNTAVRASL